MRSGLSGEALLPLKDSDRYFQHSMQAKTQRALFKSYSAQDFDSPNFMRGRGEQAGKPFRSFRVPIIGTGCGGRCSVPNVCGDISFHIRDVLEGHSNKQLPTSKPMLRSLRPVGTSPALPMKRPTSWTAVQSGAAQRHGTAGDADLKSNSRTPVVQVENSTAVPERKAK